MIVLTSFMQCLKLMIQEFGITYLQRDEGKIRSWKQKWFPAQYAATSCMQAHLLLVNGCQNTGDLSQSLTRGSCSCCQSLVFPRLMIKYSWWRGSLGVIFMAPNFAHTIFDPLSCTGTKWIGDKLVSPLITFPGHPGFINSIRLLLNSCLSMYDNPSAQPQ